MTLSITPAIVNNSGSGNETAAASGNTSLANATAIDGSALVALGIYVQCLYNASATAGAVVKVYGGRHGDYLGVDPVQECEIPFVAGAAKSAVFSVLTGHKAYKVVVFNLDTAHSLTAIYVYSEPQILT